MFKKHFTLFYSLLFVFIVGSWPFVGFPLTDGDIAHWTGIAKEIQVNGNFLTSAHDQSHGPFLAWTSGILSRLHPDAFYLYNLSNLLCGVLGIMWIYYFALKNWKNKKIANLSVVLASTSVVWLYLSRTPMYDWPAAVFLFGFMVHYVAYVRDKSWIHFWIAIASVAIGVTARFSIVLGLSGIFIALSPLTLRRTIPQMVWDGLVIVGLGAAALTPWLYYQHITHGPTFMEIFLYDNVGRYIKEPGNAPIYRDYYGFFLYVIVGLLPHSFYWLASLFQKGSLSRLKHDPELRILVAGWLPCLLAFSFSGHVKLGRYIAYVFPMIFLFLGYSLIQYDLDRVRYRKIAGRMTAFVAVVMAILLALVAKQNPAEVAQSPFFAISAILLVVGTLVVAWVSTAKFWTILRDHPHRLLPIYAIIYLAFFSSLAWEYSHAPFLTPVRDEIRGTVAPL